MAVYQTKHFASSVQRPQSPPTGNSLEEQMNTFLQAVPLTAVADIRVTVVRTQSGVHYLGVVIYQE